MQWLHMPLPEEHYPTFAPPRKEVALTFPPPTDVLSKLEDLALENKNHDSGWGPKKTPSCSKIIHMTCPPEDNCIECRWDGKYRYGNFFLPSEDTTTMEWEDMVPKKMQASSGKVEQKKPQQERCLKCSTSGLTGYLADHCCEEWCICCRGIGGPGYVKDHTCYVPPCYRPLGKKSAKKQLWV